MWNKVNMFENVSASSVERLLAKVGPNKFLAGCPYLPGIVQVIGLKV